MADDLKRCGGTLSMKKVVIGAAMLLSRVIGLVGWFIACTLTVKQGGRSRVWGCLVQRF